MNIITLVLSTACLIYVIRAARIIDKRIENIKRNNDLVNDRFKDHSPPKE